MISKLNSIKIEYVGNYEVDLNRKEKIKENWIQATKNTDLLHENDILVVTDLKEENLNFNLKIKDTTFSHFIYNKKDQLDDLRCLFSGGYIVTADGYVGAVLNNVYKDNPYMILNLPGGMADYKDIENGTYSFEKNLKREFKEELGMDLDDDNFSVKAKYVKYASKDENPVRYAIGIIHEIQTKYTKDEIEKIFSESEHDNEVNSLVFFKKENYKDIYSYEHIKAYIPELWEEIYK